MAFDPGLGVLAICIVSKVTPSNTEINKKLCFTDLSILPLTEGVFAGNLVNTEFSRNRRMAVWELVNFK